MNISQITTELESLKSDISFPITKQELLTLAENKQVSDEAKQLLSKLPEGEFHSIEDVLQKIPFEQTIQNDLEGEIGKVL